jgi:hypothetical protein
MSEQETEAITFDPSEWRDLIAVKAIAAGVQGKFHQLVEDTARGRVRNTVWLRGYMQCLRDLHTTLTAVLPAELTTPENASGEVNEDAK